MVKLWEGVAGLTFHDDKVYEKQFFKNKLSYSTGKLITKIQEKKINTFFFFNTHSD